MWFANLIVLFTSEQPILDEERAQMTPPIQLLKRGTKEWNQVPCTIRKLIKTTHPLLREKHTHICTATLKLFTPVLVSLVFVDQAKETFSPIKSQVQQGLDWGPYLTLCLSKMDSVCGDPRDPEL